MCFLYWLVINNAALVTNASVDWDFVAVLDIFESLYFCLLVKKCWTCLNNRYIEVYDFSIFFRDAVLVSPFLCLYLRLLRSHYLFYQPPGMCISSYHFGVLLSTALLHYSKHNWISPRFHSCSPRTRPLADLRILIIETVQLLEPIILFVANPQCKPAW